MKKSIVGFGEVLWDLLPGGKQLGGAPLNFIYRVNGLGNNGIMVSRLGHDELGKEALAKITLANMDTSCIQTDLLHPTGTVNVTLDEAGKPDFEIVPDVAYDYIEPSPTLFTAAASADCLCFGTLAQRTPQARQTLETLLSLAAPAVKLLDINLRKDCYTPEVITKSISRANLLKLNDDEVEELSEMFDMGEDGVIEIARALVQEFGLRACVVTLGSKGALAVTSTDLAYSPGFAVEVVDTVGSGDSFTAGFLHKYLQSCSLVECCEFGNAVGALVAGQPGGTCPLAHEDIQTFLASKPQRLTHEDFL